MEYKISKHALERFIERYPNTPKLGHEDLLQKFLLRAKPIPRNQDTFQQIKERVKYGYHAKTLFYQGWTFIVAGNTLKTVYH